MGAESPKAQLEQLKQEKPMQEQRHQGKSADNPHGHSSSDLRDLEALAVKKGNQGP